MALRGPYGDIINTGDPEVDQMIYDYQMQQQAAGMSREEAMNDSSAPWNVEGGTMTRDEAGRPTEGTAAYGNRQQKPGIVDEVANRVANYAVNKGVEAGVDYAAGTSTATGPTVAEGAEAGWPADVMAEGYGVGEGGTGAAGAGASETGGVSVGQAAGAIGAAKGAYDTYQGWEHGGAGMRTGLTTMGAGIGSMIMPGLGTAAGAAMGNAIGYGIKKKGWGNGGWKNDAVLAAIGPIGWAALAAKYAGLLTPHKTTKQRQGERFGALIKDWEEKGYDPNVLGTAENSVFVPRANTSYSSKGQKDLRVDPDFVGYYDDPSTDEVEHEWINNRFATSRNVQDLKGDDIIGYVAWLEKYGPEWLTAMPESERIAIAEEALNRGLVSEHHGMIDIKDDPEFDAWVAEQRAANKEGVLTPEAQKAPPAAPQAPTETSESKTTKSANGGTGMIRKEEQSPTSQAAQAIQEAVERMQANRYVGQEDENEKPGRLGDRSNWSAAYRPWSDEGQPGTEWKPGQQPPAAAPEKEQDFWANILEQIRKQRAAGEKSPWEN